MMLRTVAVLCVARDSAYHTLEGIDIYDISRDARSYTGLAPIVGHPPCRAWSRYCAHQAKPLPGEKDLAPFVVDLMRRNGGVLEHPAHSMLWDELDLPLPASPPRDGLWSMAVNQCWWGDPRVKRTWLLFSGVEPSCVDVPFALHDPRGDRARWNSLSKRKRSATTIDFAKWLVAIARASKSHFENGAMLRCAMN